MVEVTDITTALAAVFRVDPKTVKTYMFTFTNGTDESTALKFWLVSKNTSGLNTNISNIWCWLQIHWKKSAKSIIWSPKLNVPACIIPRFVYDGRSSHQFVVSFGTW